jgi:nicotinate-nucleotide pyrophosphorylase (carboxylating)
MDIPLKVREFIRSALEEDIGAGDITSGLIVPEDHRASAVLVAKGSFILAGLSFAEEVFMNLDRDIKFTFLSEDGSRVRKSTVLARMSGRTRSLLAGERVALNILQRLSGIATLTNKFVKNVEGLDVKILDTRKTTPGMRYLEKYAVRTGGGHNHRFGLYDGILIKDNHIEAAGGIKSAIVKAKEDFSTKIEVEAESLKDVKDAVQAGADIIMLDNMSVRDIKKAVRIAGKKAQLEVSGNIILNKVRRIAETGVDFISIGALTHSAPAADISMKLVETING